MGETGGRQVKIEKMGRLSEIAGENEESGEEVWIGGKKL